MYRDAVVHLGEVQKRFICMVQMTSLVTTDPSRSYSPGNLRGSSILHNYTRCQAAACGGPSIDRAAPRGRHVVIRPHRTHLSNSSQSALRYRISDTHECSAHHQASNATRPRAQSHLSYSHWYAWSPACIETLSSTKLRSLYTRIGSTRVNPQSTIMYRIQNSHTHCTEVN